MRIHYLQHVAFEDAANIARWARDRGHGLTCTRLDLGEPLPEPQSFDWLVVMGGPMNIYEHDLYPWLVPEKQFIRRTIRRGTMILGVCLGAQLLADVLGAVVTRNPHKEIGWHSVTLTEAGTQSPWFRGFPASFTPLHWHGDTFSIPPGAVRLAGSEACANQAFQYGDNVLGLQFHLDYCEESLGRMIANCGDELVGGPWIQSANEMLRARERMELLCDMLYRMLDAMQDHAV